MLHKLDQILHVTVSCKQMIAMPVMAAERNRHLSMKVMMYGNVLFLSTIYAI